MRRFTVYWKLAYVPLVAALLFSCGADPRAVEKQVGRWILKKKPQEQQEEYHIVLKHPYTEWDWEKAGKKRLTVQNAVWAVTKQAGVGYNRQKSYDNTDPICKTWIRPNIETNDWQEAVEEILAPVNLKYVVENGDVVLMTQKQFERKVMRNDIRGNQTTTGITWTQNHHA